MRQAVRRLFVVLVLAVGAASWWLHFSAGTSLVTAPDVSWASPRETTLNNLGPVSESSLDRNYACTPLSYRMIDDLSKTMHDGCFVAAAFGMVDQDRGVVIFNGTDEAEEVRYGGSTAALNILPYSASVARFGGFPGQGAYMYLYTYFPSNITDSRDIFLHRYKDIAGTPNFTLPGPDGQPLAVNPLALAYSARGQWLVTESPSHALLRVNLATYSVLPFADSFTLPSQPYASHTANMAITQDGRYTAVASTEFGSFKVYDLKNCGVTSASDALAPQHCQAHDYWNYVSAQVAGQLKSISQIRFVSDSVMSFTATTNLGAESYELAPDGSISSLIPYLGLGDSFASGQGAWNYLTGTDTAINHCHLSAYSYPLRLNADLFGNAGHSVACSGATTHDVGSLSAEYTGQASDQRSAREHEADGSEVTIVHDFSPGYLAQQRFVESYQPGVISLQIGGNDVGFGQMLLRCMSPASSVKVRNPNSCFSEYEDRLEVEQMINRSYGQLVALYKQLRQASPKSRIYIIGYPQIIAGSAQCGFNVHVTFGDIEFARDTTNYLNGVILKATRAAGVTFVDVSDALAGHQLCDSGAPAVNGITAGNDALGLLGQESFHPNAFGHELLEQAILKTTKNFRDATPVTTPTEAPPTTTASDPLLQAPHSGRSVRNTVRASISSARHSTKGGSLAVKVSGVKHGLKPNSRFTISLNGSNIGSTVSDGQGNIQTTVTIPASSETGQQPISVDGPGQNGDPISIIDDTHIDSSGSDADGDGVPNNSDSCPLVPNAGTDSDGDGVDDACDYNITPPTPTPSSGGTSSQSTNLPTTTQSSADPQGTAALSEVTVDGLGINVTVAQPVMRAALRVTSARQITVSPSAFKQRGSVLGVRQATKPQLEMGGKRTRLGVSGVVEGWVVRL